MAEEKKKTEEINMDEIGENLARELGMETSSDTGGELEEFFKDFQETADEEVVEEPQEQKEVEEPQKWVHEPTGKEFDSELEYLKYNSGWTTDKLGTENKELRERLERLENSQNGQQAEPQKYDEKEVMKLIWEDLDEETLNDPAMKLFYKGLDRTAGILQQQFDEKLTALKGEYDQLRASLEEDKVRAQFGVEPSIEQKILEKHPSLKQLPAKERMAVMKELVASKQEPERASRKLADKLPQQRAEDHVENSAQSVPPESTIQAVEKKLDELGTGKNAESVLGSLFQGLGDPADWASQL